MSQSESTRVLITGANGQLGRELRATLAATDAPIEPFWYSREQLDIGDSTAVQAAVAELAPQLVINAAAYTAVDKAESEAELAARVNTTGPGLLAAQCQRLGARMIHVSTDFVFDGSAGQPYTPAAATAPIGVYGRSKLDGERAANAALPGILILRTGWLYSRFGGNFVNTMLRLMAEREQLAVVDDQIGTPTWARGLAQAIWRAAELPTLTGCYHWSDAGVCSWYDFAVAIAEEALAIGLLQRPVAVRPIPASDYPTPARRPAYSVLDKRESWRQLGLTPPHWRVQLRAMLAEIKEHGNA